MAGHSRPRVVSIGEVMVELARGADGRFGQSFGGDTFNTAVYLRRCGAAAGVEVAYATALGEDSLSTGLIERWRDQGIDTRLVRRIAGRMPGLYMIEVDARGERSFHYWRETAAAKAYFDIELTPIEARIRARRSISSNVSTSERWSQSSPSAGMQ